jgi:hypothetical protein
MRAATVERNSCDMVARRISVGARAKMHGDTRLFSPIAAD